MRTSLSRKAFTFTAVVSAALVPAVSATSAAETAQPRVQVRFLDEHIVPHKPTLQGTTIGGLSGFDRDPCTGEYALISDDRSYLQPARFYTANIDVDAAGIHAVDFTGTHPFRQPDGQVYPPPTARDGNAVDPEEIRVDPKTCEYWWAQEGNRPKKPGAEPVIQPSIQLADRDGGYRDQLTLPENYAITTQDRGPRRNQVIEAITFGARGDTITSAVEGPLIQDGPEPTVDHGALIRLTQQDRNGGVTGQYTYPLEKIFAAGDPESPWGPDTGVPAILAFPDDPTRYLVLERTWVAGAGFKVRIFDATTRGATEVQSVDSLAEKRVVPMRKTLVADFHDLPLSTVDNTEGMTWGPTLPTGERTLLLISDDNFAAEEVTQVVALAVR